MRIHNIEIFQMERRFADGPTFSMLLHEVRVNGRRDRLHYQ